MMARLSLIVVLALIAGTSGASNVRGGIAKKASGRMQKKQAMGRFGRMTASSRRSSLSAEDKEATPSERRQWMTEWQKIEGELFKLIGGLGGETRKVRPVRETEIQLVQTRNRVKPEKKEEPKNATTSPEAKKMPEVVVSKAVLAPMLGLLKSTYEDAKARIGQLNAQEKKEKEAFTKREKEHKEKMAKIEAQHQQRLGYAANMTKGKAGTVALAHDEDELYKN